MRRWSTPHNTLVTPAPPRTHLEYAVYTVAPPPDGWSHDGRARHTPVGHARDRVDVHANTQVSLRTLEHELGNLFSERAELKRQHLEQRTGVLFSISQTTTPNFKKSPQSISGHLPLITCVSEERSKVRLAVAMSGLRRPLFAGLTCVTSLYCPQDRVGTDVQTHRNATKAPLTGNRSTKPPPAVRLGPSDSTSATPTCTGT